MSLTKSFPFVWYLLYRTVFHPTEQKISRFKSLKKGWHYGEGVLIHDQAVQEAISVHHELVLRGFYETNAFPGLDGEIQITVYEDSDYFSFEREPSGDWIISHEQNGTEIELLENQNLKQVSQYTNTLRSRLCSASAFYRGIITGIETENDSMIWPSSRTAKMEGCQLLTESVR